MNFLTQPIVKNGAVVIKRYDGTPRTQLDRVLYWALTVFTILCLVAAAYLLMTVSPDAVVTENNIPSPGINV